MSISHLSAHTPVPAPAPDAGVQGIIPMPRAPVGPALGSPEPEGGLDWRRVLAAVRRFKWLIMAVTAVGTALGVVATRFVKASYVAQATIWIDEPDQRNGPDRGPIRPGKLLDPEAWVDLLKSYVVLDDVVREQHMFLAPKSPDDAKVLTGFNVADQYRPGAYRLTVDGSGKSYTLATDDGIDLQHGALGDSIGARLGFRWAPSAGTIAAGSTIEFSLAQLRDAARRLSDALDVRMDLNGNFLRMELEGDKPDAIAAVVNAIAERYVAVAADMKRQKLTELTKILDDQLASAKQNLQQAENALEGYRVQTITLPQDRPAPTAPSTGTAASGATAQGQQDPVFSTFFNTQLERDQARRDREALQRVIAQQGDSGLPAEALSVVGSVQQNPELVQALQELGQKQAELRALRYRYSDAYPPVQRLVGQIATLERQTIPALAKTLVGELGARDAELTRRLDADSRNLRAIPARAIEEARLRRGVTLAEDLYTTLQQRYEEARLAEASTVPDVRILDHAVVPQRPVKNTAPRVIMLGFVASLGLAVFGAVLLDRVDPKVRYPDQVSRELGLSILGAVPHLRTLPRAARGRHGGRAAKTPEDVHEVVEALRGVCLNLVYAHGGRAPLLITVTSPGAGDGKSFLAANLAHTFADGGHRALLIDGDIRRGVLHRRLSGRRRPGLSDYLRGESPLDAIIQATPYPALSLIGCGTRAYNAPELLGSPAMGELINGVRSGYDVVLVDSPPLGAGVDPLILGTLTGTLVLVLRTGYSHRDVAAAKLEVLQRLPVRMLGAILNDVPAGGAYSTYSYYLPGYEAIDEDAGDPRVPV
jgi:capsular exopolysaccharide synthesis family protein